MRRMWKSVVLSAMAVVVLAAAGGCQQRTARSEFSGLPPKNVIVMVSDGMGPAAVTLTRLVSGKESLTLDEYLVGTRHTSSQDKMVTDSAAAATAMATGRLTRNDYVGVTAGGQPLGGILEAARFQKKMATGMVVKSSVTHATPAGFSAHVMTRADETRIAAQQLGLRLDVMFGGGKEFFMPVSAGGKRRDGRDLLAEARSEGYQVIGTAEELSSVSRLPVVGLFAKNTMHYDIDRAASGEPSLEEMTRAALRLLSKHEGGFLLMIEGSELDHAAHSNDGATLVSEVLGYDAAFGAAVEFAKKDGRTLVVSTSDHETGGLTITGGDWGTGNPGPRRLRANKVSADAMVTMITNGKPLAEVLREQAGVTNVTSAEAAAYEAATPGIATERQKRRIAALVRIINTRAGIRWGTVDHSAVDVNVYAYGPGQEMFRGARAATWTATAVAELLDLDLEEATREAQARINGDVGRRTGTAAPED